MENNFRNVVIEQTCEIDDNVTIGDFSIIGKEVSLLSGKNQVRIKGGVQIGTHVVIYQGVAIEKNTQIEDFCRIGENSTIGENCRIVYGVKIYGEVTIGSGCVIGGFICEDVTIGNYCRIFGELVHAYSETNYKDMALWDKGGAKAPVVGNNVFIGFGAKIIGGITIGDGAFIFPNAIVTKNVPSLTQVKGINEHQSPV